MLCLPEQPGIVGVLAHGRVWKWVSFRVHEVTDEDQERFKNQICFSSPPPELCDHLKNMETEIILKKWDVCIPPTPPPPLWHRRDLISARVRSTCTLSLFCSSEAEVCLTFLKPPSSYYWVFFPVLYKSVSAQCKETDRRVSLSWGKGKLHPRKEMGNKVTAPPLQSHSAPGKCLSWLWFLYPVQIWCWSLRRRH